MQFFPWRRVVFWGGLATAIYVAQGLGLIGGSSDSLASFEGDKNVIEVPEGAPNMEAARAEARATLPTFLAKAAVKPATWENVTIKVALQADGPVENIWVSDFQKLEGDRYAGRLANDPVYLGALKAGDPVDFTDAQIVDWAYVENGVGYGFYSVHALLGSMSEDQVAAAKAFLAPAKVPATW